MLEAFSQGDMTFEAYFDRIDLDSMLKTLKAIMSTADPWVWGFASSTIKPYERYPVGWSNRLTYASYGAESYTANYVYGLCTSEYVSFERPEQD